MSDQVQDRPQQGQLVVEQPPYSRRELAAPVKREGGTLMAALTAAATNQNVDVAKVKELYAMLKEMEEREAERQFNEAMARAQAKILPVAAKAWNSQTSSNYAKLEAIDRVITPIHTAEGLSVSYDTETKNDDDPIPQGFLRVVAWVRHAGGHKVRHHIDLPADATGAKGAVNKTMVHAIGSTNSYARRYLKMMIFNVSTYDDRDGNGARGAAPGGAVDANQLADQLAKLEEYTSEADFNKDFAKYYNAASEKGDKEALRQFNALRDRMRQGFRRSRQ